MKALPLRQDADRLDHEPLHIEDPVWALTFLDALDQVLELWRTGWSYDEGAARIHQAVKDAKEEMDQ